jgi:hypothetical protein
VQEALAELKEMDELAKEAQRNRAETIRRSRENLENIKR